AEGLERDGREHAPPLRPLHLRLEPARVLEVAPEPLSEPLQAFGAEKPPELERAEAAAERDPPVAQVLDPAVDRALQIARVRAHHAHEVLGVAYVVERAVEGRAQPLVRVEDEGVRAFDA